MPQEFTTTDVLALEVRDDPTPPPGHPGTFLHNYVRNNNGDRGAWGWLSPLEDTYVTEDAGGLKLSTHTAQSDVYFTTELLPLRLDATHVRAYLNVQAADPDVGARLRVEYLDDAGAVLSSSAQSALTDVGVASVAATAIPAGTVSLRYRVDLYKAGGTALAAFDALTINNATLVQGSLGELTDPDGIYLDDGWTDILGPTLEVKVARRELNLGTLEATIYGPELDPSTADTIRAGKEVRLVLADVVGVGVDSGNLFTGEVLNATVDYDLLHPDPLRRTKITLSAVDRVKALGNVPRPDGVASLAELPAVLEGAGVPWNVNGETGHTDTPIIVAHNDNATALDQIAITRDSNLAYAWVDRWGALQAWADLTDYSGPPGRDSPWWRGTFDEDVYSSVAVDYDTDRCINIVTLKYLRLDPTTGETEEIAYGPYVDLASVREWREHAQEFTVQGIAEDPATLAGYADAILAANATPRRRLREATAYLRTTEALGLWSTLDLYDVPGLACERAGIVADEGVVTGIEHTITADLWTLRVSFDATGGVAIPQAVPSPPPTAAKSLAELLRPVGEVTMFYGLPSAVPAGWLVLDGAAFDPVAYPALADFLGAAVLPDFTDRIPVGAGIKALGAASGSWTKILTAAQVPPHTHPIGRGSDEGTSGTRVKRSGNTPVADANSAANASGTGGAADPVDVTPRVLALYLMIRAVAGVPT